MRVLIGTTVLLLILPKVVFQCLLAWYNQQKITLSVKQYAGKNAERIEHRTISVANAPLSDIDTWFLYLKGAYDLIGPSPIDFEAADKLDNNELSQLQIAPGIISPFKVKQTSGIAHQNEHQLAVEFAQNATVRRRAQIFLIWCFQQTFSSPTSDLFSPSHFKLLGVTIMNVTMKDAVSCVIESLNKEKTMGNATKFAFVNADCANKYHEDTRYKRTLNAFSHVFADGIGVKIAARWQNIAVTENVNGTDMFPLLCTELVKNKKSVYLLGASQLVITKMVAKLNAEYPDLKIAGYSDGFTHQHKPEELHTLINESGADLLLVAMGAPLQEQWIANSAPHLTVKAAMGVGGLFDFYSEEVSRAPIWLRELSLEWVWRLGAQPLDKGKRYLVGNPLFLLRASQAARNSKSLNPAPAELNQLT